MEQYDIKDFLKPEHGQKGKDLIALATRRAKAHHKELKTKQKFPGVSTKKYFQEQMEAHTKAVGEDPYGVQDLRKSDLDMSKYIGGKWVTIDELRERIKAEKKESV